MKKKMQIEDTVPKAMTKPEHLKEHQDMHAMCGELKRRNDIIEKALFGDEESIGAIQKLDQMWTVFVDTKVTTRTIIKVIVTLGAIAAAIAYIISLFKGQSTPLN